MTRQRAAARQSSSCPAEPLKPLWAGVSENEEVY